MKKTFILLTILLLAASCNKEHESETVVETLHVSGVQKVKAHLTDGVNAVWDAGDQVSVFFNGGSNECWNYTGPDGASQGTISREGTTYRVGSGYFTAVYPYSSSASMSGDVVTTSIPEVQPYKNASYGYALMVSYTEDASLQFNYACAFLRLSLSGVGAVKSVSVRGNNDELLAGNVNVNVFGDVPSTIVSSGSKIITVSNGGQTLETLGSEEKDFWIAVAPGTFTKGLEMTVTLANGNTKLVNVSGTVTINEGEVLCVHDRILNYMTISADFTNRQAFTPNIPAGTVSYESTYSFVSGGNTYSITCHPSDGRAQGTYEGSYLIGFNGAWIKLPVLDDYALYEVEYKTAGQAGQPYISKTNTNPTAVSNQIPDKTTVGQNYTMTLKEFAPGQQYYLMVGAGNLRMSNITLRYIAKN